MRGYPVFLSLEGRTVTVIGAGKVARRKVDFLVEAGARVRVVGPSAEDALLDLSDEGKIELVPRPYVRGDLEGAWLAFAATSDTEVNLQVWEEAQSAGIPVNVATGPNLCDFTVPSMVRRGDLCIAISTGASSPRLARRIRERLEEEFGAEYEPFLEILSKAREKIVASDRTEEEKRKTFDALLESAILDLLQTGKEPEAQALAERILNGDQVRENRHDGPL
jgi:precorrin-2 dehydrogenase/sirohydrochlorin ferrochelatase